MTERGGGEGGSANYGTCVNAATPPAVRYGSLPKGAHAHTHTQRRVIKRQERAKKEEEGGRG